MGAETRDAEIITINPPNIVKDLENRRGYHCFRSPHPLSPSPQGEGGISIVGGHPQTPARGISLWTPFTTDIARSARDEAILGVVVGR
jgi:hypothetical protein